MLRQPDNDTGQVSLDFVIGASLFVITFFFVYNLLTGLLLPFQTNSEEVKPMADRVSKILVESTYGIVLTELNPNIVDDLPGGRIEGLNDALYNDYDSQLHKYGLVTSNINYNMHVSLRYFNNTLYNHSLIPLLDAGPTPDDFSNVGQTERAVYLFQDSQYLILQVKVWL